jgi:GNAT superfamily N-acetyltransferase
MSPSLSTASVEEESAPPPPSTSPVLHIQRLTPQHKLDFYGLIQEQAEQHASADHDPSHVRQRSDDLYGAIVDRQSCGAFLVTNAGGKAVAAVTFYDCRDEQHQGLYLEDIVTTASERGKGIGTFAFTHLARLAAARGVDFIAWECAAHNQKAQDFYTDQGAAAHYDRHTWRRIHQGPLDIPSSNASFAAPTPTDETSLSFFLKQQGHKDFKDYAHSLTARSNDPLCLVAKQNDQVIGLVSAYRSFSTFRIADGIHVESLMSQNNDPEIAKGLLASLDQVQHRNGWTGHTDFTVHNRNRAWQETVLQACGFKPLAYGNDKMVVRSLRGTKLEALSHSPIALQR